jgi:predicted component of type VI protein secretion system
MYLLKLFHETDPVQPIDAHMVGQGTTIIGRDPAADWVICDPDCEVSRKHCAVVVTEGGLAVRSMGTNGVFRGEGEERLPEGEDVPMALGDSFSFGKFRVVVDRVPFSEKSAQSASHTMVMAAPFGESAVPSDWADADGSGIASGDGSLLEAFCEGAGLDASAFSAEEPTEIMRRAGAIYRQMVLGLGDLMSERSSVKTHYRMDRTTIGAHDNNPFKWAPTQRLAVDLLLRRDGGFLSGPAALKASFEDVKRHLLCTLAGYRASLLAVLEEGRPARIGKELAGQSRFLKSRAVACWEAYERIHKELDEELREDRDGPINQAFINAYEERMRQLDKGDETS